MAPLDKVWDALVNPKTIEKWSRLDSSAEHPTGSREVLQKEATSLGGAGPAKMSSKNGFSFSLWGGDIWGKNIKVTPKKELIQEWFAGKWPKPSIVTFPAMFAFAPQSPNEVQKLFICSTHAEVSHSQFCLQSHPKILFT